MTDPHSGLKAAKRALTSTLAGAERRLIDLFVFQAFLERAGGDLSQSVSEQAGIEAEIARLRTEQAIAEQRLMLFERGRSLKRSPCHLRELA